MAPVKQVYVPTSVEDPQQETVAFVSVVQSVQPVACREGGARVLG